VLSSSKVFVPVLTLLFTLTKAVHKKATYKYPLKSSKNELNCRKKQVLCSQNFNLSNRP
jgi:hypothetical protein